MIGAECIEEGRQLRPNSALTYAKMWGSLLNYLEKQRTKAVANIYICV